MHRRFGRAGHRKRKVLIMEELVVAEKIGELVLGAAINKLGNIKAKKNGASCLLIQGSFF